VRPYDVETPQELADKVMAGLKKFGRLSPARRWAKLIELGLIDEEGRVAKNIGGRAKTKRPVSPKLLAL
jgi:hypothetical protein